MGGLRIIMAVKNRKIKVRLRLVIIKNSKLLVTYDSVDDYYYYLGGKLEFGETIKEGAIREIKEELGNNIRFTFKKILYIRDFLQPEKDEHSLELFILGEVNKFMELEHHLDPEHGDKKWATWLDIKNLPDNLYPKPLSRKLLDDYRESFTHTGEYVGKMDSK